MLTYIITTKGFVERHSAIVEQAVKYNLKVQFVWRYDKDDLDSADFMRFEDDSLSPQAKSCLLKHFEAQSRLLDGEDSVCLILEDDALLSDEFDVKLSDTLTLANKLEGPWLIFLGGMDNALDSRFFESASIALIESWLTTAEAYLVNRESCLMRMRWLMNNTVRLPADHLLTHIDRDLSIPQYRVSKPFVTQGSITGRFKSSLDSSRIGKTSWYLRARYTWNRFRNQLIPRFLFRSRSRLLGLFNQIDVR